MRCRKNSPGLCIAKILCVVLVVGSLFGVIGLKSEVVSLRYSLGTMEKQKTQLMRDNKLLMAERARLTSIERFEKVSMKEAGFMIPDRRHVVAMKLQRSGDAYKAAYTASAAGGAVEAAGARRN